MKIIWDLFGGLNGSVRKASTDENVEVYTFDILPKTKDGTDNIVIDLSVDINELIEFFKQYPKPDIITASPLCLPFSAARRYKDGGTRGFTRDGKLRTYSSWLENMSIERKDKWDGDENGYSKTAILGKKLLENTYSLIEFFKPKSWYVENPRSSLFWKLVKQEHFFNPVNYGDFGFISKKPTMFHSNVKFDFEIISKFNNKNGTRIDALSRKDRSDIPIELLKKILKQFILKENEVNINYNNTGKKIMPDNKSKKIAEVTADDLLFVEELKEEKIIENVEEIDISEWFKNNQNLALIGMKKIKKETGVLIELFIKNKKFNLLKLNNSKEIYFNLNNKFVLFNWDNFKSIFIENYELDFKELKKVFYNIVERSFRIKNIENKKIHSNITLRNGTLIEKNNEFFFTKENEMALFHINRNYDPKSTLDPYWNEYFGNTADADFWLNIVASVLIPSPKLTKIFWLFGEAEIGKSHFLKMISDIYGYENTSSVSVRELSLPPSQKSYQLPYMSNKLVNISDEYGGETIKYSGQMKELASGLNPILANNKYAAEVVFTNRAKLFFATNKIPKFDDFDSGDERRHIFLKWSKINNVDFSLISEELLDNLFSELVRRALLIYKDECEFLKHIPEKIKIGEAVETKEETIVTFFKEIKEELNEYKLDRKDGKFYDLQGLYNLFVEVNGREISYEDFKFFLFRKNIFNKHNHKRVKFNEKRITVYQMITASKEEEITYEEEEFVV